MDVFTSVCLHSSAPHNNHFLSLQLLLQWLVQVFTAVKLHECGVKQNSEKVLHVEEMCVTFSTHIVGAKYLQHLSGNLEEKGQLTRGLAIDGRIILKCMLTKQNVTLYSGLSWLRSSCEHDKEHEQFVTSWASVRFWTRNTLQGGCDFMVFLFIGCMILGLPWRREITKQLSSIHATLLIPKCRVDYRASSEDPYSRQRGFVDQCPPLEPLFRSADQLQGLRQLERQCNTRYTTILQLITSGTRKLRDATNYI